MTGAQILIQSLIDQGVDTIFGYPGGSVLNIYDALYDYQDKIRHIVTSHEQGAAHAADGYARSTGKPGVVLATSGPGATNLVTGLATAYMDSVPVIAITGNVALDLLGRDSFQEIDITGITMPITKHNFIVKAVDDLAWTVKEAFIIAASGRPGPVLIDIPKNIAADNAEYVAQGRFKPRPAPLPAKGSINDAVLAIQHAERPLIYAGGGIISSGASKELLQFAKKLQAPIVCTMMGLGSVPSHFETYLGMIGMHGTPASNHAAQTCDLLIAVGARFSDRVAGNRKKFAPNARILHVDIDSSEFSKNVTADITIEGDAKAVLSMLTTALQAQSHDIWLRDLMRFKVQNPLPTYMDTPFLNPYSVLSCLKAAAPDDTILVTDVGQHQMFVAQSYPFAYPRTFLSSGGLGTMGFGMGAAIGAKVANPGKTVVLVTGDGSFHMNLNELACAVSEGLPIVVLIFNNTVLGMVRQWQKLFYNERYSFTSLNRKTDFTSLAAAFGCQAERVADRDRFCQALSRALESNVPYIIDCIMDKDSSVYPMIPPGGTGEDIIYCDDF